ncbi:MAG: proton-conducting transporter membrane subunit [Aquificaceae bacterium]
MSSELGLLVGVPLLGVSLGLIKRFRSFIVIFISSITLFLSFRAYISKDGFETVGGWLVPLGIGLRLDTLSANFILMTALVCFFVSIYSLSFFKKSSGFFWVFFFSVWTGLNGFFLSEDFFNLYVALEVLSLAGVSLVASAKTSKAIKASIDYLFISLMASLMYLMSVGVIYLKAGTLSISDFLSKNSPFFEYAMGLIAISVAIKCALFPFHFWLVPAHASALSPASAILSALLVKPPAYLIARLIIEFNTGYLQIVLSALGAIAIAFGSIMAMRQQTIKTLLAYSTVAQIGYIFLILPLFEFENLKDDAVKALSLHAFTHALAKASMFLASGNSIYVSNSDEISLMPDFASRHPLTFFGIFFSGASLMGLPTSGGFIAKFLILKGSIESGLYYIGIAAILGGLLAGLYIYPLWKECFEKSERKPKGYIPIWMELSAFSLGLLSFAGGVFGF